MNGKAVISLLVLAIFAFSAAAPAEQHKKQHRRVSRLRNRPDLFNVEGSNAAERRPHGLLDGLSEGYTTSSAVTSSRQPQRQLKVEKMAKAENLVKKVKEAKLEKIKKAKNTRQESNIDDMSMSMTFRQIEMSMSMDFRQVDLSMSM
jgi:hypothetical protein